MPFFWFDPLFNYIKIVTPCLIPAKNTAWKTGTTDYHYDHLINTYWPHLAPVLPETTWPHCEQHLGVLLSHHKRYQHCRILPLAHGAVVRPLASSGQLLHHPGLIAALKDSSPRPRHYENIWTPRSHDPGRAVDTYSLYDHSCIYFTATRGG